ncbi:hypothetical protein C5167_026138 [Papaver somniferum]|nr:hypothetical protein C5167_026138 [Papaver somniferum]
MTGSSSDSKVEIISRLAQWRIESFGPCSYRRSDSFKLGIWNWHISIEKNRYLYVRLFPEPSRVSKEQPPLARFVLRVSSCGPNRRPYISPTFRKMEGPDDPTYPHTVAFWKAFLAQLHSLTLADLHSPFSTNRFLIGASVHERLLRTSEDFVWPVDSTFLGRIVIDVEFLDLKICQLNGGDPISIWPGDGATQSLATQRTLCCLSRMLNEEILTDVTINTSGGTLRAHKAILSASSPVFQSMFLHDLKEKESSMVDIEDISVESCMALLSYLYGTIKQDDFWRHRLALLGAAHKYDILDLKDACEESLLEDINSGNVLERLQEAWLYQLDKLKKGCLMYLFDFGKIYDVKDEIDAFFRNADRELMVELFHELLTVWKPA